MADGNDDAGLQKTVTDHLNARLGNALVFAVLISVLVHEWHIFYTIITGVKEPRDTILQVFAMFSWRRVGCDALIGLFVAASWPFIAMVTSAYHAKFEVWSHNWRQRIQLGREMTLVAIYESDVFKSETALRQELQTELQELMSAAAEISGICTLAYIGKGVPVPGCALAVPDSSGLRRLMPVRKVHSRHEGEIVYAVQSTPSNLFALVASSGGTVPWPPDQMSATEWLRLDGRGWEPMAPPTGNGPTPGAYMMSVANASAGGQKLGSFLVKVPIG